MSGVVLLHSKTVDFQERLNRCPEGRVEDFEGIYEELIAPMESRMMRSVWRVVRNPELAADVLQDALTIIWKKMPVVCRHPNPQALIMKICLNAAYDVLRKRKRFLHHEEISILNHASALSDRDGMSALEAREMESEVLQAIARLPRKQALAVLMRLVQDESFDVIARTLDCSEVTARLHVSKGRARLRQWLAHLAPCAGKEAFDECGQKQ